MLGTWELAPEYPKSEQRAVSDKFLLRRKNDLQTDIELPRVLFLPPFAGPALAHDAVYRTRSRLRLRAGGMSTLGVMSSATERGL